MSAKKQKDVRDMTKEELVSEAEARGVAVTRGDGSEGDPTKADYLAALSGESGGDKRAAPGTPENTPPGQLPIHPSPRPLDVLTGTQRTGYAPNRSMKEITREEDEEAARKDRESRTVNVVALRDGEYPTGVRRIVGEEFGYVQPEDEEVTDDKSGKKKTISGKDRPLPSWLRHVDGDLETLDLPANQEPGIPHKADGEKATVEV